MKEFRSIKENYKFDLTIFGFKSDLRSLSQVLTVFVFYTKKKRKRKKCLAASLKKNKANTYMSRARFTFRMTKNDLKRRSILL